MKSCWATWNMSRGRGKKGKIIYIYIVKENSFMFCSLTKDVTSVLFKY